MVGVTYVGREESRYGPRSCDENAANEEESAIRRNRVVKGVQSTAFPVLGIPLRAVRRSGARLQLGGVILGIPRHRQLRQHQIRRHRLAKLSL